MILEYRVTETDENLMIKDIVKKRLSVSSRLYKKIVNDIRLNENTCYKTDRVKRGDLVSVNLDNSYSKEELDKMYRKYELWDYALNIVYEDEYILCVNKEKGIVCHPSALHQTKTIYNAVLNYYINKKGKIPIHFVNRLDKDTTGIVILAKHKYIQEMLISQMKNGNFSKKYIAIVYGKMDSKEGIIEEKIRRKEDSIILREVTNDENGEYAKTGYKVIEYNKEKDYSVLEITLYTGRTHQIRVHFSSIGHPLLGDELYIKESNVKIDNVYEYINRQALHAYEIKFCDLVKRAVTINANLPEDISRLISKNN